MKLGDDSVVRAITDDGAFRVITARTTETVRGAVAAQSAKGRAAKHFGELLTGYDVLDKIATAPARGDKPQDPVKILKVTVRPRTPDDKKQGG